MRTIFDVQFLAQLFEGAKFRLAPQGNVWKKTHEYPADNECRIVNTATGEVRIVLGGTTVYPAQD